MHLFFRYCTVFFSVIFLAACVQQSNPTVLRIELETTGLGKGRIEGSHLLQACEDSCVALVRKGEKVSFQASALAGSSFVAWEGACKSAVACSFTASDDLVLRAVFEPDGFLLRVETSGMGSGAVSSEVLPQDCQGLCEQVLSGGERVRLEARAFSGSRFAHWGGACSGQDTCELSMESSKVVVAQFETLQPDKAVLQVERQGSGTGTIFAEGINCADDCTELVQKGQRISLNAKAAEGSSFARWSGACEGPESCTVSISEATLVAATFERNYYDGDLRITEIGGPQKQGDLAWLELYNASGVTLDLSDYQLRTWAVQRQAPFGKFGRMMFDLPSKWLEPGDFVYVAATLPDRQKTGARQAYLLNVADTVPYWSASGFVELIRADKTIDFVRFGSDKTEPLSESWQGENVVALSSSYGQSLVRDGIEADSNRATDWRFSKFATPAGPNDVPANAQDADGDGLPDSAEVSGGRFAGLDLYSMGARVNQKDIFVEVDHMLSQDAGIVPQREALDKVVLAFAKRGFALHFDAGMLYSDSLTPALYNLGAGESSVPFAKSISIPGSSNALDGRANFFNYKAEHMDVRRKPIFHYLLMANSQRKDGQAGSSGIAEINGNDLMITMGNWGLNTGTEKNKNILINFQASTIMHELGHNLGLKHGGDEHVNYKPNYLSVMNYMYQLYGIAQTEGTQIGDRYYAYKRWQGYGTSKTICDLRNSPCSQDFTIDYSDGKGQVLTETLVNEAAGLGRSSAWIDYDNSGSVNTPKMDVNGDAAYSLLHDHNDWANIFLPFQQTRSGMSLKLTQAENQPLNVLQNDQQSWIQEPAPSKQMLNELN